MKREDGYALDPKNSSEQIELLDNRQFFKKKYRLALQTYVKLDIVEYAQLHPSWAAKMF